MQSQKREWIVMAGLQYAFKEGQGHDLRWLL